MIQGTTPTHTFNLPIDVSLVKNVRITYAQCETVVLQKEKGSCSFDGNSLQVKLTQEETLLFSCGSPVKIQLRIRTTGGDVLASDLIRVPCGVVLDKAVLE